MLSRTSTAASAAARVFAPLCALLVAAGSADAREPELPLQRAAWAGDDVKVRQLLDGGAPIEQKDPTEWTALHWAAVAGRTSSAALLLDRGADPNARGQFDLTPLHWAALTGRADAVALLVRRGARLAASDVYGSTPLHLASNEKTINALLDAGADIHAVDEKGMTPLHAVRNEECGRALLTRGADMRLRDRAGRLPMQLVTVPVLEPRLTFTALAPGPRLREDAGVFEMTARNVGIDPLADLTASAKSPACTAVVDPQAISLAPGQRTRFRFAMARTAGVAEGEHPFVIELKSAGRSLGEFELPVNTSRSETLEDRGMIRVGQGSVRQAPSRWSYLVYLAAPALFVAFWLWRRRQR